MTVRATSGQSAAAGALRAVPPPLQLPNLPNGAFLDRESSWLEFNSRVLELDTKSRRAVTATGSDRWGVRPRNACDVVSPRLRTSIVTGWLATISASAASLASSYRGARTSSPAAG